MAHHSQDQPAQIAQDSAFHGGAIMHHLAAPNGGSRILIMKAGGYVL